MDNLKEIINKVYLYYPKNVLFDSIEYQSSKEYLRLLSKREESLKNVESKNYLKLHLENIFKNYKLIDWTALDAYNCYEYRILLHKDQSIMDDDIELLKVLGYERLDLYLFISVLENYYYYNANHTKFALETDEWSFKTLHEIPSKFSDKINDLDKFLMSKDYVKLSEKVVNKIVIDIETELKSMGNSSVFDCFFTDLIAI